MAEPEVVQVAVRWNRPLPSRLYQRLFNGRHHLLAAGCGPVGINRKNRIKYVVNTHQVTHRDEKGRFRFQVHLDLGAELLFRTLGSNKH